jgi:nicotinamide riboside transporter PnuC
MKRLRWEAPDGKVPAHPYRDSAVLYAALAAIVVVVTFATGGDVVKAVPFAAGAFVLATGYSWWRWRVRLRRQDQRK